MTLYWSVLFLIISHHRVTPFFVPISFSDLKEIASFAYDTYNKYQEFYGIYEAHAPSNEISLDDVLKEVRNVASKVEEIGAKIERHLDSAVATLLQRLPLKMEIIERKSNLNDAIINVDSLFDRFIIYSENSANFNNITIRRFINSITQDAGILQTSLTKIHKTFVAGRTKRLVSSLFKLLNKQTSITANEICDTGSTPQLELYRLYEMIMKTHIRGFLMITFANLMLEVFHETSFQVELKIAEREVITRAIELMAAVKKEMKTAPRDLRRCDPRVHKRGETYLDFYNFMQSFIANELKLNSDDSCKYSCSGLPKPIKMRHYERGEDKYQAINGHCDGQLVDCSYGGAAAWEICTDVEAPRQFSYFVNGYGSTFGKKGKCTDWKKKKPIAHQPTVGNDCDFCECICVRDTMLSWAFRKFSFKPQIADIRNNKVVTGVRFVDIGGFLNIQIKEGRLYPDGRIDSDTEIWKEPETLLQLNNMTRETKEVYVVRTRPGQDNLKQRYGRDYTFMTYDQRQINLDDLFAPTHHVVTGIRFQHPRPAKASESQPIEIAIHVTPFNYATGKLGPAPKDGWLTPNPKADRTKLDLKKKKNPINSPTNLPDSKSNSYVEVQNSDWWEDAAQSTIPFIDKQPVEGKPGFPLSGISLIHRAAEGYGGFLALKIHSLDLPEYMSEEIPEQLILS